MVIGYYNLYPVCPKLDLEPKIPIDKLKHKTYEELQYEQKPSEIFESMFQQPPLIISGRRIGTEQRDVGYFLHSKPFD